MISLDCREKTEWHGEYKGVSFEIQRYPAFDHMRPRKFSWTFYLYIHIDRIPEENTPDSFWLNPRKEGDRTYYDYCGHGVLSSVSWHGGMTWYSKESGLDGTPKVIKAGCDYQHYGDDWELSLDELKGDVIEAIDSFRAMVPGYRYWCRWDGGLHAPCAVAVNENGSYTCGCTEKNRTSSKAPKLEAA